MREGVREGVREGGADGNRRSCTLVLSKKRTVPEGDLQEKDSRQTQGAWRGAVNNTGDGMCKL